MEKDIIFYQNLHRCYHNLYASWMRRYYHGDGPFCLRQATSFQMKSRWAHREMIKAQGFIAY